MEYVQMTLNDWMSLKGKLEEELRGAAASFVRIGFYLREIEESEGYKNDGSATLAEWAKDNYGLSASAVSRFMAINRKYSIDGYSDQLRLEYSQYGSAKLSEMLALPDSDLEMVSPEMKREDIREIKKFNKEAAKEEAKAEEPAADQREEPHEEQAPRAAAAPELPDVLPEHKWIIEFFRENKEIMNDLYSSKAFAEGNVDAMKEIVNPSGARTYRHRMTMVSMMDARIMVKVFPKSPAPMSWGGFFQIAADIFEGKIDGKNTYRNVFGEEIPKREPDRLGSNVPKQPTVPPMPKNAEPAVGKTEPETPIAPAQKEPPTIDNSNVKTDSAIAEEPAPEPTKEPEQVEIEEIIPAPEEPDPMRDLKDRFTAEMNSLRVMLDCDNFSGMAQTIERLEHLRIKMAGLAALK